MHTLWVIWLKMSHIENTKKSAASIFNFLLKKKFWQRSWKYWRKISRINKSIWGIKGSVYYTKQKLSQHTIGRLFCTMISENEGLKKLRSVSNLRKISCPEFFFSTLEFFSVCQLYFFSDLYHKPEKNSGDKLKKKSGVLKKKSGVVKKKSVVKDLKFF